MRSGLLFCSLIGCRGEPDEGCGDATSCFDVEPQAVVVEPEEGATFAPGEIILLRGVVQDDEDAVRDLVVTWVVDDATLAAAEPDAHGIVEGERVATLGDHVLELRAYDSAGNIGGTAWPSWSLRADPHGPDERAGDETRQRPRGVRSAARSTGMLRHVSRSGSREARARARSNRMTGPCCLTWQGSSPEAPDPLPDRRRCRAMPSDLAHDEPPQRA